MLIGQGLHKTFRRKTGELVHALDDVFGNVSSCLRAQPQAGDGVPLATTIARAAASVS